MENVLCSFPWHPPYIENEDECPKQWATVMIKNRYKSSGGKSYKYNDKSN